MSDVDVVVVNQSAPYVVITSPSEGIGVGPTGATGPKGTKGDPGYTIHNGDGAPSSVIGRNGDFYMDNLNFRFYGPKANGTWPPGRDLRGPTGPTGPAGPPGPAGPQGSSSVVNFAGTGSATTAARSDHTHPETGSNTGASSFIRTSTAAYAGKTVPSGAKIYMQMGTHATTTGSGGQFLIPLPMSFPNGIIGAVVSIGASTAGAQTASVAGGATNQGVITAVIYQANGGIVPSGSNVRVNYIAFGW